MKLIHLEKETDITHTKLEINQETYQYTGEMVFKSTGTKRYLGGQIANMKLFLGRYYRSGFERVDTW